MVDLKTKARVRRYYERHKAKILARNREYLVKKLATETAEQREQRLATKRIRDKGLYEKYKPARAISGRKYYLANKAKIHAYNRARFARAKKSAYALLGDRCSSCGFSDPRVLNIDHRNGKGRKERRKSAGTGVYLKVLRNPDDYQILCCNCNWIKKYEAAEGHRSII